MKKIFTLFFLICAIGSFAQVRISQVYGGGGNTAATYNQDFVELFNAGTSSVNLTGWSVQYGSAAGTTNWLVVGNITGSIAPGGYYLVAVAPVGAVGIPLPTPDFTGPTTTNLSGTSGKVALVNNTTLLVGAAGCGTASVVDVLGYGTPNCAEGTAFATTGITTAQSMYRKTGGCTETNNNTSDFELLPVLPRNSGSSTNSCGAPTPSISAGPAISNLTTTLGVASAERSYNLSGLNLTPAAGNISVTPGANLEISLTSGGPYTTGALSVPYSGGTLASTPVYVRIAATAPAGVFAGTINNSGGGATAVDVNVTGGVATNYYNTKANLGLDNLGTWSSTLDGTGPSPANFTDPYAYFNVVNATNTSFNGVFDLPATTSRLVVGNGTAAFNLVVPAGANNITSTTRVDVLNNATLTLLNNTRPFFNNLATGSTVDFAQTGTTTADTIKVPAISFYNLKLTNGLKYFLSGIVTIRGNFTADAVLSMNGALSPFTTINAFGDVTFLNNAAFEPLPTGDAARLTLKMNGPGPIHNLNSNGTNVLIFRLQRDSVAACTVNTGGNTILTLGNAAGGGLTWGSATASPILNLAGNILNLRGGSVVTNTATGKIAAAGAFINVAKSAGATHAGTLRFEVDASLTNFVMNLDPAVVRDSIIIADDVEISTSLNLIKGKVVMATDKAILMPAGSSVLSASTVSFVDGTVSKTGNTDFGFPVGKGSKFAPCAISALSGSSTFVVNYQNSGYGTYTIDPATLLAFPNYEVSKREWWNINRSNSVTALVTLSYTDATSNIFVPNAIRVARFDAADWEDRGGIPDIGNTTIAGLVTTPLPVTNFGPFTFSAIAAGVLPVSIANFNVVKQNNTAKISWTTQQEINSREFMVERSANGRNWAAIKTVAAAGNSSTAINYTVIDEAPVKGYNYYRIRMIDLDNKATQTAVKHLYFSAVYSIAVSPNPASDFIKVDVAGYSGKAYTVSVTDAAGRKVYETKSSDAFVNISAAKFTKGVYIVIVSDEGNTLTQKVVLQ